MEYEIRRTKRRSLSIEITTDCKVIVRSPFFVSDKKIEDFVFKNIDWINKKLNLQSKRQNESYIIDNMEIELRNAAKEVLPELILKYSKIMNLYPTSVKITSAKKRFGSCSGKNGICFSWRLMAYPKEAVDYVVVHELSHIKYHNHSNKFYKLIEKYLPDYKLREKALKNFSKQYLTNSYL